ncbi:DUF6482 family protein [Pseudomonas sp. MYb118]|uniref:DUF6482 family protein n=1 Tax=Pseudomonas sp. MYb118 TaxID=1848720 RepID=UPI0034CF3308
MNFEELHAYAIAGKVEELNVLSLEGGIYLIEARMHGAAYPLSDARGQMYHLRSIEHAREVLRSFPDLPLNLVHTSVQDEMCGMAAGEEDCLKVPLGFGSAWHH